MTCVEVMYQPPGFPGASFQAYPREPCSVDFSIRHTQNFAKLQEPLDLGTSSSFTPVAPTSPTRGNTSYKPSTAVKSPSSSSASFASPASVFPSPKTPPSLIHHQVYREPTRSESPSVLSATTSSSLTDVFHHHFNTNNYSLQPHHHQLQQNLEKHHRSRQTKCENDEHNVHEEDQKLGPFRTDYLGVNCVLYTFFSEDVRSAVDDHFTRSMDNQGRQQSRDGTKPTDPLPMAERNLPPSFWNSSYYQLHHPHSHHHSFLDHSSGSSNYGYHHPFHSLAAGGSSSFGAGSNISSSHNAGGSGSSSAGVGTGLISGVGSGNDLSPFHSHPAHPYFSPTLQGLSNLQSAAAAAVTSDPWSAYCNSFASPAAAVSYPHRPVPYDFSNYSSTSRFGQKYSSFLMQPSSMRPAHLSAVAGHCDVTKTSDFSTSSRSRYSDPRLGADYPSGHHTSFAALDATSLQDAPTKDLYWF